MSVPAEFVCRGAPRDLGFDQGRAFADAIRREAAGHERGLLGWLIPGDARIEQIARDVGRFFPHMAERGFGLARGAGSSRDALAALLARELADDAGANHRAGGGAGVGVATERSGGGALLGRSLEGPAEWRSAYRVRRSEPEHDYRSVEVVLPWLVPPVAGVNEHGLAAAIASLPSESSARADCRAPAALLVQDCLQRFDRVERAVEWCERRPAGGRASLLLADAHGDLAIVRVDGPDRRVERPAEGLAIGLCEPARRAHLEKACLARARCDAPTLTDILSDPASSPAPLGSVLLDPTHRKLHLKLGPERSEFHIQDT